MKNHFLNNFFDQHKLVMCMGPGGVGKTSVSAALAIAAASMDKKVLVLTLDPSKSLATALGLTEAESLQTEDFYVQGQNFTGKLFASCPDAQSVFDKLLKNTPAQKIQNNRIYKHIIAGLQGREEFSSIVKLVEAIENQSYDLIVLDTPPMQESLNFLKAPEKFQNIFSSSLAKWLQKGGQHAAVRAISRITGAGFISEMADFFNSLSYIQPLIIEYSQKMRQLLRSPHTAFVLIGGFDEIKIQQIEQLHTQLRAENCQIKMLILNRLLSCAQESVEDGNKNIDAAHKSNPFDTEFKQVLEKFSQYYWQQLEVGRQLEKKLQIQHLAQLPDLGKDICSLDDLSQLANELKNAL